jgi:hypothetical protein
LKSDEIVGKYMGLLSDSEEKPMDCRSSSWKTRSNFLLGSQALFLFIEATTLARFDAICEEWELFMGLRLNDQG